MYFFRLLKPKKAIHLNRVPSDAWRCSWYSKCFFKIIPDKGDNVAVRTVCIIIFITLSSLLSVIVMISITGFRYDVLFASL